MLTIFTIPKPFTPDASLMQRNAIRSWLQLRDVQVILAGEDAGVADAAAELGCEHYPALRRTELGTPRLDDAFAAVERLARHPLICYVNADIILLGGFQASLANLNDNPFLVVGRRLNVWLTTEVAFERERWDEELWEWALREGQYAPPAGSDYFIYRRGTLGALLPFAVGRPYWDNWMMYMARRRRWPLVDATPVIRAIHQNHDYGHVPNASAARWEGPEGDANLRLAGGYKIVFTLADATHTLEQDGPQPIRGWSPRLRRGRRWIESLPGVDAARTAFRLTRSLFRNGGARN